MYDYDRAQARPRMQRMSVTATFQKCPRRGMVKVRTRLVGRIGSVFTFHFVRAVAQSGFRETLSYHRHHHHRKVC